ncbi:MAG: DUF6056 family protein [Butyrivibrio sp.]|nr:DUF6056 family protein [Butyrivibrio sp.]
MAVLYVLSLIPMLVIGFYDWPSVDDFSMALQPHQTFVATGNFFITVGSAFKKMVYIYNNWVGYFFSDLLTCLCPSIFGEKWYFLTPVIILAMLSFGVIYFFRALFVKVWELDGDKVNIAAILTLFIMVHSLENGTTRAEAFYWYSGAINYTFMFGLLLVWIGMILRVAFDETYLKKAGIARLVLLGLWSFCLGGANYMTSLVAATMVILVAIILLMIRLKKFSLEKTFEGQSKALSLLWIPVGLNLAGFAVSVVAPGNRIRGTGIGNISPIKAVLRSYYTVFAACFTDMMRWEVIFLLLIIAVVCWKMAGKMKQRLSHPFIFALFAFSMVAVCIVPPLFAVGNFDSGRIRTIIWMQFVVMVVISIFYIMTGVRRAMEDIGYIEKADDAHFSMVSSRIMILFILVFACGSLLCIYVNPHYYSATSAAYDVYSGDAATYLSEKKARMEIFEDDSVKDVVLDPHTVRPELLFQSDIYEDSTLWENTIVATYYGKDSVAVRPR